MRPEVLFHRHMHAPGGGMTEDGLRVSSLGQDQQEGNLAILNMNTLVALAPSTRELRGE